MYGYDTAYCLKSHCGVRGVVGRSGYFSLNLSDNSVMRGRVHAGKDVERLSCGFEGLHILVLLTYYFVIHNANII